MITYESKNWFWNVLTVRGTILPAVMKRLWWIVGLTVVVWLVDRYVPNADPLFKPFKPVGHTLLGLALGLLIVFHNNCAYDRYWEGRKLWGSVVNHCRNLVRGAAAFAGDARDLARLVSAYVIALKQLLRQNQDLSEIQPLLPADVYAQAATAGNAPNMLALHMSRWIVARVGRGDPVTAQSLESVVRALLDAQGGCERILKTPIPFAYAVHIKQMLTVYLVTLPFALVGEMGWAAIPTVAVVSFGMLGIEEAGNEIENPFGNDPNDLPLDAICTTIHKDVTALAEAG